MIFSRRFHALLLALSLSSACPAVDAPVAETEAAPQWSVSFNVGELAGFTVGSVMLGVPYLPLHFDANYVLSQRWQLNLGFVFRYDWGSFIGPEFIGMAGMRYSLSETGLYGGFLSLKAGPGYVNGYEPFGGGTYSSFEFAIQPEIGHSWALGTSGYFTLGLGVMFIIATPQSGGWNALGVIVHQIVPIGDLSFGFTF
ncbi:hypothetical protein K2X33_04795 [bacterium]|nr:hypothetical protein [bacterium]